MSAQSKLAALSQLPRPNLRRWRLVLRLLPLALVVCSLVALLVQPIAAQTSGPRVDVTQIDGTITPVMADHIKSAVSRVEKDGASALVIEMNTPGGLSSAMDDIIQSILQSKVPVVVYVSPRGARAASAGTYITYAAHIAAMAPGTNIGSASPVFMDSSGNETDGSATMRKKVTNDAVAQITNLAKLRGRNATWAASAVTDAANITADQALQQHVVDVVAPDLPTLLNEIDGRTVQMANGTTVLNTKNAATYSYGMTWMEQFLQLLADPTIAYILLSLGMLGLVLELSHPGVYLPGVVGGLFIIVALFALGTLPVNWAGVLLIGLAFVLFALDLYVTSFGTLTAGGVISFVIGSYLLIGSNAPPGYTIARPVIWTMTLCIIAFFLLLAGLVLRARLRPPVTGRQALIGQIGVVRQSLNPVGMVYLNGELWSAAKAFDEFGRLLPGQIPVGTEIVVTAVEKMRLRVRPATVADLAKQPTAEIDPRQVVPSTGMSH